MIPREVREALDSLHTIRAVLLARRASACYGDPPDWCLKVAVPNELGLEVAHATIEAEAAYEALRQYDRENRALLAEALTAHAAIAPIRAFSAALTERLRRSGGLAATITAVLDFRDGLARIGGEAVEAFISDLDQTIAGLRDAIFAEMARRSLEVA